MTGSRITESQILRSSLSLIQGARERVNKYSLETSSGVKVARPGDDASNASTISDLNEALRRFDQHKNRIESAKSVLSMQDSNLGQVNNLLIRAKELATQGANETLGVEGRRQLSIEVFQLRDSLVALANTTYQGKYIYSGGVDNVPPYQPDTVGYTNFSSTSASQRYTYLTTDGADIVKSVNISDNTAVTINTPGNQVFDSSIQALETLGRALEGYSTTTTGGAPDGGGVAYIFPSEFSTQTQAILDSISLLDNASKNDISTERVNVAGKLSRTDNAAQLIDALATNFRDVLSKTQGADVFDSVSNLSNAQNALQASLSASGALLKSSLLDYL